METLGIEKEEKEEKQPGFEFVVISIALIFVQ